MIKPQNLRKPSEFISNRKDKISKLHVSNDYHLPEVISFVKEPLSNCTVSVDRPIFKPEPSNLTIEGFTPFKTYEFVMNFRNSDQVPRKIRVEQANNPYFSVSGYKKKGLQSEKIAPGMETQFVVTFTPEEQVDYIHELECVTERETFLVPIKAIGARGCFNFPDTIVFNTVPARCESTKSILVKNVGDSSAQFHITTTSPFSIAPPLGYVGVGESIQFNITLFSTSIGDVKSSILVKYDTGEEMLVGLLAFVENINVRLNENSVKLYSSISTTAKRVVSLVNQSNVKVNYTWKQLTNSMEETHVKARRNMDLMKEEQDELDRLAKAGKIFDKSVVKKKYQNKMLEVDDMNFLFQNSNFRVEPPNGSVWPGTMSEITVYYHPLVAGAHQTVAYCEVEGRESRLPLVIKGSATGPRVKFSYTDFNVKQTFINTEYQYEVVLENIGDIDAKFLLLGKSSETEFQFNPNEGVINCGEQLMVRISFTPHAIGHFKKEFIWELEVIFNPNNKGGSENLSLFFEGEVVGPTFEFDVENLKIGKAALGFPTSNIFNFKNTSLIPLSFKLQVLANDLTPSEDFTISPDKGKIPAKGSVPLNLIFCPQTVSLYESKLVVYIDSVGESLNTLSILAESVVPKIVLKNESMDLSKCFINHLYQSKLEMVNTSTFSASYALQTQENIKNQAYTYKFEQQQGIIEPNSILEIPFQMQLKRLGVVIIPILINILGSSESPLLAEINAIGTGPTVSLSTQVLDWGKLPVLESFSKKLNITNTSPIPANLKLGIAGESPVFTLDVVSATILPNESVTVEITVCLDDCVRFTDVLRLEIINGDTFEIPLIAKGQGSTVVFDSAMSKIDFHEIYSNHECSATFVIINKGRRSRDISWGHLTSKDPTVLAMQVFEVEPPQFILKPKSQQTIKIKGYSNRAMAVVDKLVCFLNSGKYSPKKTLAESLIRVKFINPALKVTPASLLFKSVHTKEKELDVLSETVSFQNMNPLPITVSLKTQAPFSISSEINPTKHLLPGELMEITVTFDPSCNNSNRVTTKELGLVSVSYLEHPQKDFVNLISEVYFPNLTFDKVIVDFGSVQNYLEKQQILKLSNSSSLPVHYSWYFIECEGTDISQIFDILPIYGVIKPGKTQEAYITYFALADKVSKATLVCDVQGGPKYEIRVIGTATPLKLEPSRVAASVI